MSAKVSLIVVQGKPEGKVIPLATPRFRVGRGEGCHLRPNNEQVSRNHCEIEVTEGAVVLRDLGSRNGTYLNNQRIEANTDQVLKNKDLVQIGPLTFAVSIQGLAAAASTPPVSDRSERAMAKAASLDELSNDEIDSWLVTDKDSPAPPDRPSGVYTGDTMTFSSYQETSKSDHQVSSPPPAAAAPPPAAEAPPEVEAPTEDEAPTEPEAETEAEPVPLAAEADDMIYDKLEDDYDPDAPQEQEEFVDESNPFHTNKVETEEGGQAAAAQKKEDLDSSKAAEDILRKMMERRRATR